MKKELIEEAKKRYPIGSKVESLFGNGQFVDTIVSFDEINNTANQIWFSGINYNLVVWKDGKWAKRLDKQENLKLKDLKVGGYYKATQKRWGSWYIHIESILSNSIYTYNCFTEGNYFSSHSWWADDCNKWEYAEVDKTWFENCVKNKNFELYNKKQTKMTNIKLGNARKWPVKDLTDGQEFLTKQGKVRIVKYKTVIYLVSNNPSCSLGTKPKKMPAGYNYGWTIWKTGWGATADLTCEYRFNAFKQEVVKNVTTKFKADIVVSGVPSLLKALIEEAVALGWKSSVEVTSSTNSLKFVDGQIFINTDSWIDYHLADDWYDVLQVIEETKEVDNTEYVEFLLDGYTGDGFTKGRIYQISDEESLWDSEYSVIDDFANVTDWPKDGFKPSTEEAFKAQGPNINSVGGHKINIKEVKINGYNTMKMACIGCANSKQVYSQGALKALLDVMCDSEGYFSEEDVSFTKEQVEALIKALN